LSPAAITGAPLKVIVAGSRRAITDQQGRYALANLPPGSLAITARNLRRETAVQKVQLGAGDDLTVDFVIPASPMISGRVTGPDGEPLAETPVWVVQSDSTPERQLPTWGLCRHGKTRLLIHRYLIIRYYNLK